MSGSGEALVQHFRQLGLPGADHLVGDSYDWLFLKARDDPLATFLLWFMDNITPNNMLTPEELKQFEALEAAGEVLSISQLQEMESALSSVPSVPGASEQGLAGPLPSPDELKALQDELELLTLRKNLLNSHKMELLSEMDHLNKRQQKSQTEMVKQLEASATASYRFTKAQQDLAGTLDTHLNAFRNFDKLGGGEEAVYLSQVDLEDWHTEEEKITHLLTTYVQKQFREGVEVVVAGLQDSHTPQLDVTKLDLSLVCGAGKEQYSRNVAELQRLGTLLPQTEEWRHEGLMLQERRKAEVQEAERLLAALHQGHLPKELTVLRQQTQEVEDSLVVVEREFRQQQQALRAALGEVAELESIKVISGDYKMKLQQQDYFLNKQNIVVEQLVGQAARHSWVTIALQTEGQRVAKLLEVLHMVNARMAERDTTYRHRMAELEAMRKKSEEDRASRVLPPPLHTLACLLPPPPPPPPAGQGRARGGGKETLVAQVQEVVAGLRVAQDQVDTITSPQFSCLTQMRSVCEALEASLFGSAGSLQALPLAWLEAPLAHRCTAAEHKVWEFKQRLISIISQYEKKKKILQVDPTVSQELRKWVVDVFKQFSRAK